MAVLHQWFVERVWSDMSFVDRELIAYGIIAVVLVIGLSWSVIAGRRRRRRTLRLRGDKRYGH